MAELLQHELCWRVCLVRVRVGSLSQTKIESLLQEAKVYYEIRRGL